MTIRVLLVDDHAILREGLRSTLGDDGGVKVVGEAGSGREALERVAECDPDVVVMDVEMEELNGIEATRQILHEHPDIAVIALSRFTDREIVQAMLGAGALGFVSKQNVYAELRRGIEQVAAGGAFLGPKIAGSVVRDYAAGLTREADAGLEQLSPREKEVLQLLVEGHTTEEIADALHISGHTVGSHRQNLMRKLDIQTIPELTKFAVRQGLTPLDS